MIERKIIIGLITSTEYCARINPFWNPMLIESSTARILAGWIWEYYGKYQKCPGRDIENIYFLKLKENKLPKSLSEEFEQDILPNLSEEYSKDGVNVDFIFEETLKHFSERNLLLHTEEIQILLQNGQITEAQKKSLEFQPLKSATPDLEDFILTVDQIREHKTKPPRTFLRPWLKEGQLTIIYGNFGSGKSLLTIAIAYMLGLRNYEECKMGEWIVKNNTGCLYIDGELGELEMEQRIRQFEWLGSQKRSCKLKVLSVPEYQLATEDSFYLSRRDNQLKVLNWLKKNPEYKLVVLDSASTLFGLEEENSNSEWSNKINPFLRDLRALGVACILLHHAGKDNKRGLRGASAMGAMAHNIFRLNNHPSKDTDEGEAKFILTKDKQRASGYGFKKFSLHFYQNDDETETHWIEMGTDE